MSLETAFDNLATLLTGDADIQTWAGKAITVLRGNRTPEQVALHEMPALVLELGQGPMEPEVAGHEHAYTPELKAGFVWHEKDRATAFGQRMALVPLVTKAVMGDRSLSGAVDGAWVSQVQPDLGVHHPAHSILFTITADMMISR